MLCWNVYCSDFNNRKIKVFNVFKHWSFYEACVSAKKKYKEDKEGFAEEVRKNLMYYFWSKCEWEIVLEHWPSGELYEMRTKATIGEIKKAFNLKEGSYALACANEDCMTTVKVFPDYCKMEQEKIDVYEQVMNNWDIFIDYLWEHRKELKARKS